MTSPLQLHTIVSMPFEENTYIVWRPGQTDALVVDPGLEPDLILDFLREQGLTPAAILNTHGHADHIAGNADLKNAFPDAPLIIGVNETHLLTDPWANVSAQFGMPVTSPPADRTVADGERFTVAGIELEVREIPGHSPGHVVFLHAGPPIIVLGGDVLFRGSIGRTDFPGGSFDQLAAGIRRKLYNLPDETVVYPGHGPTTTIGQERRSNPCVPGVEDS
jgi:glyoxylase-like metal-dependent hydrolase (beta-lactamase superfamily II)